MPFSINSRLILFACSLILFPSHSSFYFVSTHQSHPNEVSYTTGNSNEISCYIKKKIRNRINLFESSFMLSLSSYFAKSVTRDSRITFTLICPGYSNSDSICFAISLANNTISASLICSGTTIIRISLPA